MNRKYKVGDKVWVKDFIEHWNFVAGMVPYLGKCVTIREWCSSLSYYKIAEDNGTYYWSEYFFTDVHNHDFLASNGMRVMITNQSPTNRNGISVFELCY